MFLSMHTSDSSKGLTVDSCVELAGWQERLKRSGRGCAQNSLPGEYSDVLSFPFLSPSLIRPEWSIYRRFIPKVILDWPAKKTKEKREKRNRKKNPDSKERERTTIIPSHHLQHICSLIFSISFHHLECPHHMVVCLKFDLLMTTILHGWKK